MHTSDPDFEALKAVTRLFWQLDMNPGSVVQGVEPAAGEVSLRDYIRAL